MTDIEPCAVMADGQQASAYHTDDCAFWGGDDAGTVASLGAVVESWGGAADGFPRFGSPFLAGRW